MARKKPNTHQISIKDLQPQNTLGAPVRNGLQAKLDLELVDGRTKLGKAIAALRAQLRDSAQGLSPASELLIQRIIYKAVKLANYELRMILSEEESHHYLPMANSLRLDLAALAELSKEQQKPTKGRDIAEIIDTFRGNC